MVSHGFSEDELDRVLTFEGYGNKLAHYWFLGIEEGGGSMEQLKKRARLYDRVEDLYSAHEKLNFVTEMLNNVTLRTMSKFIMAMEGTPGWQERSTAKEYHATKLGRADGDVFLTELMPLPCPGIHAWPYPSIFPTKADYHTQVRPGRIKWLRSEISEFHPDFVICYGKGNWQHYKEIFSDVEFTAKINEQIHVGKREHSTIMLVRFLSPDLVSTALIQEIADRWGQTPTD